MSLFWRTFVLLALLLAGSILTWVQALRVLEFEPRALQTAQEIASLVNLSRAALIHSDAINRVSLIKTMTEQEGVHIVPREPGDIFESFDTDTLGRRITQELSNKLGPGTVVANSVNHEKGLWVGFMIDGDSYWLQTDRARLNRTGEQTWLIWLLSATALSLAGAALIARLINKPLQQLSLATRRVREGQFDATALNEHVSTPEIRDVNIRFNRMTQKLAEVENERIIMLAGISHDLRTPLARLRLETELSVNDEVARENMATDIGQLDAIIGKFLDYARPTEIDLNPLSLRAVLDACVDRHRHRIDMQVHLSLPEGLLVLADEVELRRVINNLLENGQRYGKSADTGIADIDITAQASNGWIQLQVRDHGPGVAPAQLAQLTHAFYRGNVARTEANGAGLGLAIVEKTVRRMGGAFALRLPEAGGLAAEMSLREG